MQEIFNTFPGAHQLLPSPNFDDAVGAPLTIDRSDRADGRTGNQGYAGWSAILREDPDRNDRLIEDAKLFHEEQDQLALSDSSVQLTRVVGSGIDTPEKIREYKRVQCPYVGSGSLYCIETVEHEIVKGNGDETVNLHSADLRNSGTGFDMRGTNDFGTIPNIYAPDVTHGGLPINDRVLGFANAYFGNAGSGSQAQSFSAQTVEEPANRSESDPRDVTPEIQSSSAQSTFASGTEDLAAGFGLSDTPQPVAGREVEVVGPAAGYVEDSQGRVLGEHPSQPEGVIIQDIPGGTYQSIGDTQALFLNEDGTYNSNFEKTGEDEVRLRVRNYANDRINEQAVFSVDAPAGAQLNLDFTSEQNLENLSLSIDENGDGIVDEQQAPNSVVSGDVSSETNPPETEASVEAVGENEYRITLSANDGPEGSGIAATHYFIEGEANEQTYSAPFNVSGGATVRFYSVDKVGNTEPVEEILAGVTPPPETTIDSGPKGYENSSSASFAFSSSEPDSSFMCSLDEAAFESCSSPKEYSSLNDGDHTFQVRAVNAAGNVDPTPANRAWTVDTRTPKVEPATMTLMESSQLGSSTVRVSIAWSGTDARSDIVRYELRQATNDGEYSTVDLPAPKATRIIQSFTANNVYRFMVRAQDEAGNWSDWTRSSFTLRDNFQGIAIGGTANPTRWTTLAGDSAASFYKSRVKHAAGADHHASLNFTGRDVAWVAHKAPNRGKAEVWIDGTKAATVDLYSPTTEPRQVVFRESWGSENSHTIQIRILGTRNASSDGTRIDINDIITIK